MREPGLAGLPSFDFFGDYLANHLVMGTSIHEASHLLVALAHGLEVGKTEVLLHPEDQATSGSVALARFDTDQLPGFLVTCVAGQVGQAMWLVRYKRKTFPDAMEFCDAGACHDQGLFAKYGGRNPIIPMGRARDLAQTMLTARWSLVERHAATLFHKRSIRPGAVSAPVTREADAIADWSKAKSKPLDPADDARIKNHQKATGCSAAHGRSNAKGMVCGVCGGTF